MSSWTPGSSMRPPLNHPGVFVPSPPLPQPQPGTATVIVAAPPPHAALHQRPHSVAFPPAALLPPRPPLQHMQVSHDRSLFGRASGIAQTRPGDLRTRPNPSSISTSDDAIEALAPPAPFDPLYAEAVLLSYGRAKRGRFKGRSDDEVNAKLDALEQRLPRYYAESFGKVRDTLGLRGGASELRVTPFMIPPAPAPAQPAQPAPTAAPPAASGSGVTQSLAVPSRPEDFRPSSAPTRTGSWPRRNGNILPVSLQVAEPAPVATVATASTGPTASPTPGSSHQPAPTPTQPPAVPEPPAAERPRVRRRSTDIVTDLPPAYAMVDPTDEGRPARPASILSSAPVQIPPRSASNDARATSPSRQHRLSVSQLASSPPAVATSPTSVRHASGTLEAAAVASARAELESLALLEASRRREQEAARREAELARREEERAAEDQRREAERVRQEEERRAEAARREAELERREDELRKREERATELARREEELRRREERAEERELQLKIIAEEASRERYEREREATSSPPAVATASAGSSRVVTSPGPRASSEHPMPSRQTTAPAAPSDHLSRQSSSVSTWSRRTSEPVSPTVYVTAPETQPPPPPPRPPPSAIDLPDAPMQPRLQSSWMRPAIPPRPTANGASPPPIPARPGTSYVPEPSPPPMPMTMPMPQPHGTSTMPTSHPYVSPPLQHASLPAMVSPQLPPTHLPPMASPPLQMGTAPPMVSPPLPPRPTAQPVISAPPPSAPTPSAPPLSAPPPSISPALPPPPPSHPDTRPKPPLPQPVTSAPILPPPSHPGRAPSTRKVPPLPPPRSPNLPGTTMRGFEPPTPGPNVPGGWIDSPPLEQQRPLEQQVRPVEQPARPLPTAPGPSTPLPLNLGLDAKGKAREQAFLKALSR